MDSTLRFEARALEVNVFLGKKKAGIIRHDPPTNTWAYYPGGRKKNKGDDFPSLQKCKESVSG